MDSKVQPPPEYTEFGEQLTQQINIVEEKVSIELPILNDQSTSSHQPQHQQHQQQQPTYEDLELQGYYNHNNNHRREVPFKKNRALAWSMDILFFLLGGGVLSVIVIMIFSLILGLTVICFPCIKYLITKNYIIAPYGKTVVAKKDVKKLNFKKVLLRIGWFPVGFILAFIEYSLGTVFFLTLIGIPIGFQHYAFASYLWWPFDSTIENWKFGCNSLYDWDYYAKKEFKYWEDSKTR